MYKKEKAIIDGMSKKKKLKAWAQLNKYEAPKGLEHLQSEIDRVEKLPIRFYEQNNVCTHLMRHIEDSTTQQERSFAWWKLQKLNTKKHDRWFRDTYGITGSL